MISKELLSEVLNTKVEAFRYVKDKDRKYRKEVCIICDYEGTYDLSPIEIANICKEWACNKNYYIYSTVCFAHEGSSYITKDDNIDKRLKTFLADTEVEAIIEACEWILKNKAND